MIDQIEEFIVDGQPELRPYSVVHVGQRIGAAGIAEPWFPVMMPDLRPGEVTVQFIGEDRPQIIKGAAC